MASYYDKVRSAETQGKLPVVAKLEGIFASLDDTELLQSLKGKTHRGCQGYSVEALWRSYLTAYVLNIPTVSGLIRTLQSNPALAAICGLHPEAIPTDATYSRFVAKLTRRIGLVRQVIRDGVARLSEHLPDFGKVVAIDSSDLTAYSRSHKPTDPDARWSKKRNKHGRDHWWFGYKVHFVADAEYELPIHVEVTSANVSDSRSFVPVLQRAQVAPKYVLADAGYDAGENYHYVIDGLGAIPIIKLNKRGGPRNPDRVSHRSNDQIRMQGLRDNPGVDRGSTKFSALYAKRVSVERLIGRAKEFRRLSSMHHRGLPKVTLHCYMSTLTIVASAVCSIGSEQSLRKVA
jgi:hypothetical protein